MARRVRIEYPGAIYHVLSRGNYRKDLFTVHKSGQAFEQALFQTCRKCGWVIADNKQKKDLAKALLQPNEATVRGERKPRDIREVVWEQWLEQELSERAKTNADITRNGKLAEWKRQIAYRLRNETDATNPWIDKALNMGHPSNVSKCASEYPKSKV